MSEATMILKKKVLDRERKSMEKTALACTGDPKTDDLWAEDVPTRVYFELMDEDSMYLVLENEYGYIGTFLDIDAFMSIAREVTRMKERIAGL